MQRVKVSRPSRFRSSGRVHVDTADGMPFYIFDDPGEFTLPVGTYTLSGGSLIGRMKRRKGATVPGTLRCPIPRRVRIVVSPNPHKAVILLPEGVIILDPSLARLPYFVRVFILFHEIGHYWHEDEAACDAFAAEEMAKRGFNPSQIMAATEMTLSDGHRRACNFEHAKTMR